MKKPLRHVLDYIILCVLLSVFIFLLIYFNGNPKVQKTLTILAGSCYITWGYFHHRKEKTLDLSIVIEYALYGILGSLLIIGLL